MTKWDEAATFTQKHGMHRFDSDTERSNILIYMTLTIVMFLRKFLKYANPSKILKVADNLTQDDLKQFAKERDDHNTSENQNLDSIQYLFLRMRKAFPGKLAPVAPPMNPGKKQSQGKY